MSEIVQLMSNVPPPFNMVVYIILIISVCGVISAFFKQVRKYACHRQEIDFKREMLDRGMSVDEIEQIIRAQGSKSSNV